MDKVFERTNPDCKFSLPEKITVRMQMRYASTAARYSSPDLWERLWYGARDLIVDWNCPIFPDKDASLDDLTDVQVTNVLVWVSNEVMKYIDSLEAVPKN